MVLAATSGWSTTRHWLHHAAVRTAVHTLLLVAERLYRQAREEGAAAPDAVGVASDRAEGSDPVTRSDPVKRSPESIELPSDCCNVSGGVAVAPAVAVAAADALPDQMQHPFPIEKAPEVPPEIWLVIMRFFLRSDWAVC
jgi:hypothetical protein